MTRFEQIAAAFPLHAQRIAEATWEQHGAERLDRLMNLSPDPGHTPADTLGGCFYWEGAVEGHNYWAALAFGAER